MNRAPTWKPMNMQARLERDISMPQQNVMRLTQARTFEGLRIRNSKSLVSELECIDCHFRSCLVYTSDPGLRPTFRNIQLVNCSQIGSGIRGALLENVTIDGLDTQGQLLDVNACGFKQVVIKGKIGQIMLTPWLTVMASEGPRWVERVNRSFAAANAEYYKTADWALDIRHAEFEDFSIRGGIPVDLIRRDPETQAVIRKVNVLDGRWKQLPSQCRLARVVIQELLQSNEEAAILIAGRRNPKFRQYLQEIHILRSEGIADPD